MIHRCLDCGAEPPTGFHPFCAACGGMVDVDYPLDGQALPGSPDPYVRFAGLLPVRRSAHLPSATYTPLVHARRLGGELGLNRLYLKDETALPTRTTKDRMAAVALAYLYECGVRRFTASSTGNSSTALAQRIASFPDMHLFLFTAEDFVARVQHADSPQITHFGLRGASFVDAADAAAAYARRNGLTSEAGFFNPGRREGLKLAFLEANDQAPGPIDWYVQAVSSAMGVYGTYKGARELKALGASARLPRLLCVQQESCAPMVRAFEQGSPTIRPEHRVARPQGIAEAILRGDPTRAYPRIRRIVLESDGDFVAVSEDEIRAAREHVCALEGIFPCFSAAAAVAGLAKRAACGAIERDAIVVVNLTGGERTGAPPPSDLIWVDGADPRPPTPSP